MLLHHFIWQFQNVLPSDVIELFQVKLRDWNLMMDPLFRWCAYVSRRSLISLRF